MGMIVVKDKERIRQLEAENRRLVEENLRLKSLQDYNLMIGTLDDPEEEDEDE